MSRPLEVYVPRLLVTWLTDRPEDRVHVVDGTMAFVDISGFTRLTERLARRGRVGAEEMSDILDATFGALLGVARADGAELVKWGGDAVLLLFDGADHAARAARSAWRMRTTLREISRRPTSAGPISLRMSVGIHSGAFHFFLVGDPAIHRELIVSGPAATVTADMESAASAGQIVISAETARHLPARLVGPAVGAGRQLRGEPDLPDLPATPRRPADADIGQLLPTRIRSHLRAAAGESEHRPIAVGFVQFSGTDALMRKAGVPALTDALDECVRTVQQATEAHDVTFFESDINRDGGKIMLTAGAPRSAGDDEDRMLRAARRIVERAGVLPVRIGVNRGHVFAGDFGPEFRRTYSVKGDAVNLAARVMARAQPGEVLATEAILAASRTAFELERLEPFFVKGKAKAVDAARVGPMRGESATADEGGAFVGRDDELALVARALESLPAGTGTLIDIVGEPGIGKSRLVAEIRARAGGLAVVSGRGGTYESTTAYFPFRRLLREALAHHFAVDEIGDPVPYLHRLAGEVPELAPWLPLLAIPFDVSLPDTTETRELDEQFRKPRLEEVTLEALRRLLPGPTVFVLEDAHLVDDASVDLLRRVESERAERPWAVLVTRRDAPSGYRPTGSEPGDVHLPLQALDADAALRLVAAETRGAPLTREVMKVIAQRAGGNPLFLAGLAKVTGRSGRLADLPESIEGLVTSQIDRLDPRDRTVLRYAAVLGMRFEEAALSEILAGRVDGGDAVAAGRLADFLERHGEGGLRFRHSLIRDVAYAGLPFRLRREAHERVGRALESRSAEPAAESELLSLHFFHAGVYDKAWTYSRIAGRRAHSRYAYVEAAELFERAVDAARQGDAAPADEIAAVLEQLGDVQTLAGAPREAMEAYRRARRLLGAAQVAAADLSYKEACLLQRLGKFPQSLRLLRTALRGLAELDAPAAAGVRCKLATRYGFGRYLQGRPAEAIHWCENGAAEGARGTDRSALAMAYNALHLAYLRSDREPDRPYAQLAMQIYEALDDLPGQGHAANTLAIAAHAAGRWDDAAQLFGRAAEVFRRIGDITNESNAVYNRADLLLRQGRFADAEPLLAEVLDTARAVDDEELVALALRERARACAGLRRFAEADELFADAGRRLSALGLRNELVTFEGARADAALRAGAADVALAAADRAIARARELGESDALAWLYRLRAGALIESGAPQAGAALAAGLAAPGTSDGGYERALLLRTEARLAARVGEPVPAAIEAEAAAILTGLGVVPAADPLTDAGAA